MAHAEKCPICEGSGVRWPNGNVCYEERPVRWIRKHRDLPICHGCNGKGWVTVVDNSDRIEWGPNEPYWRGMPRVDTWMERLQELIQGRYNP